MPYKRREITFEHRIYLDGRQYFLGVLEKGMTRGDVKRMAEAFCQQKGLHVP